jgi:hypothetical protein
MNSNGVIYAVRPDGAFEVLHTFSATNVTTRANWDGANPDDGVLFDEENDRLIGIANYGGNGSSAGFFFTGGTLYETKTAPVRVAVKVSQESRESRTETGSRQRKTGDRRPPRLQSPE